MRTPPVIENIEEMRRRAGIDDVELREDIRELGVGDLVRLTFLTSEGSAGETLSVRITRIRDGEFRGELAERPTSPRLSGLRVRSPLAFTAAQIHSVSKGRTAHEQ